MAEGEGGRGRVQRAPGTAVGSLHSTTGTRRVSLSEISRE